MNIAAQYGLGILGVGAYGLAGQAHNQDAQAQLAARNRAMMNAWPDLSGARVTVVKPAPKPETPFECDYSLSQRTADYCKWGMRA